MTPLLDALRSPFVSPSRRAALLLIAWSWVISRTSRLDDVTPAFMGVLAWIVGMSFVARTGVRAAIRVVREYAEKFEFFQQDKPYLVERWIKTTD
jgi:hypothetical protein